VPVPNVTAIVKAGTAPVIIAPAGLYGIIIIARVPAIVSVPIRTAIVPANVQRLVLRMSAVPETVSVIAHIHKVITRLGKTSKNMSVITRIGKKRRK
jgi:hypothetical protein